MIARIGYFNTLTGEREAAAADNFQRRFRAAITSQPGLVAGFWLRGERDQVIALTVWESVQVMEEGGRRANQAPLLPGQRGEDIPSPDRVEVAEVIDHFIRPTAKS